MAHRGLRAAQEVTITTGYVYDPAFLDHDQPTHPENASRLRRVLAVLRRQGILDRMSQVSSRAITRDELGLVHSSSVVDRIRSLEQSGGGMIDPDTYVSTGSLDASLIAAGSTVQATMDVASGSLDNAVCLVRPPGHHATPRRSMGFCLLNNVALAARAAVEAGSAERVLVVDFDVHHGNGTQDALGGDPSFHYFSAHQYPYYPGTGHWREAGAGAGQGTVMNVALPPGVGDGGYAQVWDELLWPWASRCRPDLILVSAGYDAHWTDPLAQMTLSLSGYSWLQRDLAQMAEELCRGRVVFVLEGGYEPDVLSHGVLGACHALMGEEGIVDPIGPSPWPERPVDSLIAGIADLHGLS